MPEAARSGPCPVPAGSADRAPAPAAAYHRRRCSALRRSFSRSWRSASVARPLPAGLRCGTRGGGSSNVACRRATSSVPLSRRARHEQCRLAADLLGLDLSGMLAALEVVAAGRRHHGDMSATVPCPFDQSALPAPTPCSYWRDGRALHGKQPLLAEQSDLRLRQCLLQRGSLDKTRADGQHGADAPRSCRAGPYGYLRLALGPANGMARVPSGSASWASPLLHGDARLTLHAPYRSLPEPKYHA